MWSVVREKFASDEREAVRKALDDIASPEDGWGFSSAGLYSFWDPETRQVLYVGLAIDLSERLGQHTGLIPSPAVASARRSISGSQRTKSSVTPCCCNRRTCGLSGAAQRSLLA